MTITANNLIIFHLDSLDPAITRLSLAGYTVLKFAAKNKDEPPSIEVDRPLEGYEHKPIEGKSMAYCDAFDCRIYWNL